MDIIKQLSPHMKPYINIINVSNNTYTYKARSKEKKLPVVNHIMHQKKGCGDSMLYIAVPTDSDLHSLKQGEKLYVGSQSAVDRMFRGDGDALKGINFHHAEMRNGNSGNNLINFLNSDRSVSIYCIKSQLLIDLTQRLPIFSNIKNLISSIEALSNPRTHTGYWFEQIILRDEFKQWMWNSKGADTKALKLLAQYGV